MHRSMFVCSVFLSLLAVTRSKAINPGNDEDTEAIVTGARLFTILPDLSPARDESNARLDSKRSLSVLMPLAEEKRKRGNEQSQDPVAMSQKTKRCKTSIREEKERISAPLEKVNQDLLKSRNTRNSYNVLQNDDSSVQPSSRLRLVSLKNPNAAMERDPSQRSEVAEYAADRNVAILKAIREKLKPKPRDDTVGAVRRNSLQKSGVIDDDKYVCYCKVKNNPSSRKEAIREHGMLARKSKAEKKEDNKVALLNENRQRGPKPIYANAPDEAYLAESLPGSRDDRRYLPNLPSRKLSPILQREGIDGIPYLPYVYRIDPEYAMLPDTIRTENPVRMNIPLKAIGGRPDSNVGQRAPIGRGRDFNQNKQTIGQRPCTSNVGETVLKASRNTTPATSKTSKISTADITQDNDRRDHSIEMVGKSVGNEESANEDETGADADGTDYSDVKQVTNLESQSGKHNVDDNESNGYSSSTDANAFVFEGLTPPVDHTSSKQFAEDSSSVLPKNGRERGRIDASDTDESIISENTSNENVAATIPTENEDEDEDEDDSDSTDSRLKSSDSENPEKIKDPSEQMLPFCNNTLLRKSIKAVINKFATNDYSSETGGNVDRETVGSTGNNLLEEITKIPNWKGILAMPPIEHTILGKVKNLLARLTGVARSNFDDAWTTNVIRNNLRHTIADTGDAERSDAELPPMTVKERQFKNGKWITSLVTLEPASNEEPPTATDLGELQATVKSLVRDPAIGSRAAKQPAVRNMIVQSVRTIFQPKDSTSEQPFDESVIRATLDDQLALMDIENAEITTAETALESESIDASDIDMEKLASIAGNEAGAGVGMDYARGTDRDDPFASKSSTAAADDDFQKALADSNVYESSSAMPVSTNAEETVEEELPDTTQRVGASKFNGEDPKPPTRVTSSHRKKVCSEGSEEKPLGLVTPSNRNFVGATRNEPSKLEGNEREKSVESHESKPATFNVAPASSRNQDESLTVSSTETNDAASPDEYDSGEATLGMERSFSSSTQVYPDSPDHDYAYLGIMTVKKNNVTDVVDADADVGSLRNSDLYYVGNGVKLPLEIRKLNDGSYALSISRKVCEHLLNKECPCCVPLEGNVVRAVRNNPETSNTAADKLIETIRKRKRNISKRESTKAIFSNEQRGRDSAVDSIHILSMPVETFAKRYNLSLSLEKVQAPWALDAKEKIDEHANDRYEEDNADKDLLRDLLSVHAVSGNYKSETPATTQQKGNDDSYKNVDAADYKYQRQKQRKFDKFRYQRNIDETVNQRVEIVTNVLNWLRDVILSTNSDV